MKIRPEHLAEIKTAIASIAGKIPAHRETVKATGKYQDLEKRVRWDALNASLGSRWICDNIYTYATDAHLDTALRSVMSELGLTPAPLSDLTQPRHPKTGEVARVAVQCVDPLSGVIGSWFFTGEATASSIVYTRVTPVFSDVAKLFAWASQNRWGRTNGSFTNGAIAP